MDDVDQQFELHPPTLEPSTARSSTTSGNGQPSKDASASASKASSKPAPSGPIPMTMPSILRNPGVAQSNHLAYLLDRSRNGGASSSYPPTGRAGKSRSGSAKELGRRKQRRSDNARLLSNPHAVRPTIKDYRLHSNEIRSTFPSSSSSAAAAAGGSKPYNLPVPSSSGVNYSEPVHDAASASQGHFGKSLRDAQRVLKRLEMGNISDSMIRDERAGELERFIWLVDREIRMWAADDVHVFTPQGSASTDRKTGRILLDDAFNFTSPPFPTDPVQEREEEPRVALDGVRPGEGGQLIEFQRTPNALVWLVHDPFLRLVVHCLARVSRCPSFSKDDPARPGLRFTWILNRNPLARRSRRGRRVSVSSSAMSVSAADAALTAELGGNTAAPRPARAVPVHLAGALDTPPTTDFDSQTETETEAETASELGTDTDVESASVTGSMVLVQPPRSPAAPVGRNSDEADADGDAEAEEIGRAHV